MHLIVTVISLGSCVRTVTRSSSGVFGALRSRPQPPQLSIITFCISPPVRMMKHTGCLATSKKANDPDVNSFFVTKGQEELLAFLIGQFVCPLFFLQPVVAYRICCVQRFIYITGI